MQVSIEVKDDKILITGPYSESNNKIWRELGGKFVEGRWEIPDNESSRSKVVELFGKRSEEVDVLVPADRLKDGSIVQIGGYVLANRRGRDWGVRIPEGVSLVKGTFTKIGGSIKHPRVNLTSDMVFRLRCRKSFAEANGLEIVNNECVKMNMVEV